MPVRLAVCGLLLSLSVTVNVALSAPTIDGVKVTSIEQLAPAARLVPQLFVCVKSPLLAPVKAILEILSEELLPLVSAIACTALVVPTVWLPNVKADGDKLTGGEAAALKAAKILPFQFAGVYVMPLPYACAEVTFAYCIAMRRLDPLAPAVIPLFGIVYPAPAPQLVSFPDVSVAKIRMSLALLVVRLPLVEVVVEDAVPLFTDPSATPELAAPENSNTMIPGLTTPPAVEKFTVTLLTAAEFAI